VSVKLRACGTNAVLLDCASLEEARMWHDALGDTHEAVLGARTVLVHGSPPELRRTIAETTPRESAALDDRLIRIPVVYDGGDVTDVADHTGLDVADIIAAHTGSVWTVAF